MSVQKLSLPIEVVEQARRLGEGNPVLGVQIAFWALGEIESLPTPTRAQLVAWSTAGGSRSVHINLSGRLDEALGKLYPGHSVSDTVHLVLEECSKDDTLRTPPTSDYHLAVGRPVCRSGGAGQRRIVTLRGDMEEFARRFGSGNVSRGIRRAIATIALNRGV